MADDTIPVALSDDERDLLIRGLSEWGGPTRPTETLAQAIGFNCVDDMWPRGQEIATALQRGEPLTPVDWARTLIATEFAFASDYYGSGVEWPTTTGYDDPTTIRRLREVQRKLVGVARLPGEERPTR